MKTLRLVGVGFVAIILCITLSSCPDDEVVDGVNNPFIGKWDASCTFGHDHVFEFQSNGEFEHVYYWDSHASHIGDHNCNKEIKYGSYSYKPESEEFILMYDDGNTILYIVSHIGEDKIILRDSSNDRIQTLTKKK